MKTILLLLFLSPLVPTSQFKSVFFKIVTVDASGNPLSDCQLEVTSSGFLGSEKYVTDKKGISVIPWQAIKSVKVAVRRRDYANQDLVFDNLDKSKNGDTILRTVTMKPTVATKTPVKKPASGTNPKKTTSGTSAKKPASGSGKKP